MNSRQENKTNDEDWSLHPLFLSKIPTEQDIKKHATLSALISIINEEEEQETFSYEPRRKNLKKRITERGEVIRRADRRNMYEPYQTQSTRNVGIKKSLGGRLLYNTNNYEMPFANINRKEVGPSGNDDTNMNVSNKNEDGNNVNNANGNENIKNNDNADNDDSKANSFTGTSVGELVVCMSMLNLK